MNIRKKITQAKKVWKATNKPTHKEYWLTVKVVLVGFLLVGFVGFCMEMLWQFGLRHLFGV